MRVVVVGANGKLGRALVQACVAAGHGTTAVVRQKASLLAVLPPEIVERVKVVEVDDLSAASEGEGASAALIGALDGCDAVINSAGHVAQGRTFNQVVATVVRASLAAASRPKRLWVLGGAGELRVASLMLRRPGQPPDTRADCPPQPNPDPRNALPRHAGHPGTRHHRLRHSRHACQVRGHGCSARERGGLTSVLAGCRCAT